MKKVIWPILLFSFMIILAGCNVTNQEKGNQNAENAVNSLDAVPTMEEWMEWTQDAEEEEKAALYEQLQALLDEATEEEVQQAVENSVKDWAEKQEWLDVEAVFVELAGPLDDGRTDGRAAVCQPDRPSGDPIQPGKGGYHRPGAPIPASGSSGPGGARHPLWDVYPAHRPTRLPPQR